MSYRLVALDIDGTIVGEDLAIHPSVQGVVAEARDQGIVVTLATGRSFPSALPFANTLLLDVPIITHQGSIIRRPQDAEPIYKHYFNIELATELTSLLHHREGRLFLFVDEMMIASQEDERTERYRKRIPNLELLVEPDLPSWLAQEAYCGRLLRLAYTVEPETMSSDIQLIRQRLQDKLEVTLTYPHFLELGPAGVHKGSALMWLADFYGIPLAETMVIGDSCNDVDMFQVAGLAVAMGDAQEEAIQAAHVTTASLEDNGVVKAFRKYVLR